MKILRAALAAYLLFAPAVQARTAIIIDRSNTYVSGAAGLNQQTQRYHLTMQLNLVKGFIDRFNPGSYDVYNADKVWTSLIKDGKVSLTDRGSTSGPYRTYGAVIWLGDLSMSNSNNAQHVGCAACSLTFISNAATAKVPTVPQLFIFGSPVSEFGFANTGICSTGFVATGFDDGTQSPSAWNGRIHIPGSAAAWPEWQGLRYGANVAATGGTTPSGKLRYILGADQGNMAGGLLLNDSKRLPRPAWRDSIETYNNAQMTAWANMTTFVPTQPSYGGVVFMRYNGYGDNSGPTGAAPNIFCHTLASHVALVGVGGTTLNNDERVNPDPTPIYMSIALLDSVSSGAVLGTSYEPARIAVQISGGFRRGAPTSSGGFAPHDTVQVGAALDSIKANLGIPFSVGVDVDSCTSYASDLALWRRGGTPHFTLESWRAVADSAQVSTTSALASATPTAPQIIDPFGRLRKRVIVGSYSSSDSTDTSTVALLSRGRSLMKNRLGVDDNSLDGILIAAADDHYPANKNGGFDDSVGTAILASGWLGVAQNADDSLSADVIRGNASTNRWHTNAFQHSSNGALFPTFPGFNPRGATYGNGIPFVQDGSISDSSWCINYSKRSLLALFTNSWQHPQKYEWLKPTASNRASAMVGPVGTQWWTEPGMMAEISPKSSQVGCNLVRITASSLGSGALTYSPEMPGYYTLKYLKYQVDAINSFGRTLIIFVYPQDLSQKDFKR